MAERNNIIKREDFSDSDEERSTEELRRDIAARRETITETVDKLSERVQRKLDWREYVVEHPVAALGIAAGLGFVVAGIFKRRETPGERILDAVSDVVEDFTDRFRGQLDGLPLKRSGPGRTVKAAITAMVTKSIVDYVGGQVRNVYSPRQTAAATYQSRQAEESQTARFSSSKSATR
jgi:ElaB/YqjD/DUF883 family membrane-anchored ribosome-binding protein